MAVTVRRHRYLKAKDTADLVAVDMCVHNKPPQSNLAQISGPGQNVLARFVVYIPNVRSTEASSSVDSTNCQ